MNVYEFVLTDGNRFEGTYPELHSKGYGESDIRVKYLLYDESPIINNKTHAMKKYICTLAVMIGAVQYNPEETVTHNQWEEMTDEQKECFKEIETEDLTGQPAANVAEAVEEKDPTVNNDQHENAPVVEAERL